MKFLVSILVGAMLFISNGITAQNKSITATIENISSEKGTVLFALHNKASFNSKGLQSAVGIIKDGKTTVVFKDVAPGEYSVVCFHDKNSNRKMDFQSNGMPLEDFGASNNVMAFAPPTFDGSKFLVTDENVTLDIKL